MRVEGKITARLGTRARRDQGVGRFDAVADLVEFDGEPWARWHPATAKAFDRAFEGWTVEHRLGDSWAVDAWTGFPARLIRGEVVLTFHADERVEVQPWSAVFDPTVVDAIKGAIRGTTLRGRRRSAAQREAEIIEAIRAYYNQHATRPTLDSIARRMDHYSEIEDRAVSTFRRWVRESGGWNRLLSEALD